MSTIKKIAKNTTLLVAANFISLGIGLVINIIVALYFSKDDYGMINWVLSVSTLFTLATDFGVSTYLTIELARHKEDLKVYLNNVLSIKLLLVFTAYLILICAAFLMSRSGPALLVVYILGLYITLNAISQIFQATFQAFQSMEHIAMSQVLNAIIMVAGAYIVVTTHSDVVAYSLVYLASAAAILVYNIIIVTLNYAQPTPAFDLRFWKQILAGGIPLSFSALFSFLYYRIDIVLIGMLLNDTGVGEYSAAYKLIEALICIPVMYSMAIFPLISSYFHYRDENLNIMFSKSIKYLYIMGMPIVIGTVLLADQFIELIYMGKYASSAPVLQALALGLLVIFVNIIPQSVLTGTNLQKTSIKINIVGTVVNVALNLLVIPVYGIVGSAYTMVITQVIIGVLTYSVLRKSGYKFPGFGEMARITLSSAVMGVLVFFMWDFNLFVTIGVAAIVYAIMIVVTRSIGKDDIALLSSVIMKKPTKNTL